MTDPSLKLSHHVKQDECGTRPPYRQGKKFTAIKVYTINDESQHMIVCGVPKLNLFEELKKMFSCYGIVKSMTLIPNYPNEEFTETYHIHYSKIQSARIAKRFLDGFNFFGGQLHVFYAPERESLTETRQKILQRKKDVYHRINRNKTTFIPETDK